MAESTLVERLKKDGQELIDDLRDKVPIAAAWWLKDIPERRQIVGEWFFFLASPQVDEQGPKPVYQKIVDFLRTSQGGDAILARVSLGRIKAIGENDPIFVDLSKILDRYGRKVPIIVGPCMLGHLEAEEVHIVYAATPAPRQRRSSKRK